MPINNNNGIVFPFPDDTGPGSIFPEFNTGAAPLVPGDSPESYQSPANPLYQQQWEMFYIEDLRKHLEQVDPGVYSFQSFTRTVILDKLKSTAKVKSPDGTESLSIPHLFSIDMVVYIISSKNGDGLNTYFPKLLVKDNEIVFFVEDNSEDAISGQVLLCKQGSMWKESLGTPLLRIPLVTLDRNFPRFDDSKFVELLQNGKVPDKSLVMKIADIAGATFSLILGEVTAGAFSIIGNVMDVLIDGLNQLKIQESGWLPSGNEKDFEPALIGTANKQALVFSAEMIEDVLGKCQLALKQIEDTIDKIETGVNRFATAILGNVLGQIKSFLHHCNEALEALKILTKELVNFGVNVVNAFLCGVVNGFVDAVIGLASLIKWVFDTAQEGMDILKDLQNKLQPFLEVIEELLVAWKNFSFLAFFKAAKESIVKFINSFFNDFTDGVTKNELYRLVYMVGNVVGFAIEFIAEVLLTGGAGAVAKLFEGFGNLAGRVQKSFSSLLETLLNISLKEVGKDILNGLRILTKFLSAKKQQLADFFSKFFAELRRLFNIGFSEVTEELFEKLGITWRSKVLPTANSGIPLKLDRKWGIYHKGILLREGTKAEIEAFGKKLKGMSTREAEKYLDDILEKTLIEKTLKEFPNRLNFSKWFNEIIHENFELIWKNVKLRARIAERIRHPGGMHEWLMVSRANIFKKWGVTFEEIKSLRTRIEEVIFVNPPGTHGKSGSTKAHNEILKLIDSSKDYPEFKEKLRTWAEKRLKGGSKKLPIELLK